MLFQSNFRESEAEVAEGEGLFLASKPGHSGNSRVGLKAQEVNQCHPYRIQRDRLAQLLCLQGTKAKSRRGHKGTNQFVSLRQKLAVNILLFLKISPLNDELAKNNSAKLTLIQKLSR